jgi:hypothetical protein
MARPTSGLCTREPPVQRLLLALTGHVLLSFAAVQCALCLVRWCKHLQLIVSEEQQALINSTLANRTLGGIHGIPRVHFKGRQGDYYIMVGPSSC